MKLIFAVATFAILCTGTVATAGPAAVTVVKTADAPAIDGVADPAWSSAPKTMVVVQPIPAALVQSNKAHQKSKYARTWAKDGNTKVTEVSLQAMRTETHIYFLASWADESKDDQHKPWKWEGGEKDGSYIKGPEREDRLAMSFPISGEFSNNKLSHVDMVQDMWHWKAARTNPAGLAHDKRHVVSTTEPTGKFSTHYDANGNKVYVARPSDPGGSPYSSNKIDPFVFQGASLPQYLLAMPEGEDARDISAKGEWKDGRWTLEFARKLDTGHAKSDTVFDPASGSKMALAVFDHSGDHFHAVSDVIDVGFE